ncbi:MAG: glycosyltransferase [Thermodesulfobacteriota bacterium]
MATLPPTLLKERPARLAFLLQDLEFGGTQRQVLDLACRLNPARFQVELWLLIARDDLAPVAQERGLPLIWLSRQKEVGPESLINLWRRLKSAPPDLLALFTVVPNIWGRILGRLARVPLIVGNCRGGHAPERQHERWLWPLADRVICNSSLLKTALTNHHKLPPARVTVIRNGVDTDYFRPPSSPRSGPVKVLSVARLVPEKDQATLIRAFTLVAPDYPEAALWLVGDGPRLAALQEQARSTLPPGKVRFFPGREDLRPLLAEAGLFVHSTLIDALPNVVLEAMAAGLPLVASRVGGLPEAVAPGETGWLVPPRDHVALAGALGHLLGDAEVRWAFGRAGRERAVQDFSFEAMVRQHEEIFHSLLAGNPRQPPPPVS